MRVNWGYPGEVQGGDNQIPAIQRHPGHFWMPDCIIDEYASKMGVRDLGFYTYFCRRADQKGLSFPSIQRIKDDLGVGSDSTVRKSIRQLESLGLLKFWQKNGKLQFQILPIAQSKYAVPPRQKMPPKEYPIKEYTIKDENKIHIDRGMEGVSSIFKRYPLYKNGVKIDESL